MSRVDTLPYDYAYPQPEGARAPQTAESLFDIDERDRARIAVAAAAGPLALMFMHHDTEQYHPVFTHTFETEAPETTPTAVELAPEQVEWQHFTPEERMGQAAVLFAHSRADLAAEAREFHEQDLALAA